MNSKIKISCLPIAGIENPYQYLMMEGLKEDSRLEVKHGLNGRFLILLKTVLKQKPDYIHYDWINNYYSRRELWMSLFNVPIFLLELFIVKYIIGVKIVWTLHNIYPHDTGAKWLHKFVRSVFGKSCYWIRVFSKSSIEAGNTEFGIPKHKFKIVPEGSYASYYKNDIEKPAARKSLKIPLEKKVFLFLGGIKPYKGIIHLIKTFQKNKQPDWHLVIAGKSYYADYLKEVEDVINKDQAISLIEGFVNKDDLQIYFNASDIAVFPFEKIENSGSVILAMGFKKPVIAPKQGVLPKRLKNQLRLLYSNKIEEAFEVIQDYSNEELENIGKKNQEEVEQYQWKNLNRLFN